MYKRYHDNRYRFGIPVKNPVRNVALGIHEVNFKFPYFYRLLMVALSSLLIH